MDGFCKQNADQLGSLAGLSFDDDDVLFVGTRFSNLYTAVDTPPA
jgi:hypothetical protein